MLDGEGPEITLTAKAPGQLEIKCEVTYKDEHKINSSLAQSASRIYEFRDHNPLLKPKDLRGRAGDSKKTQGKRFGAAVSGFAEAGVVEAIMNHNQRGLTLRDQGKLEEAVGEFREAIRLQPAIGLVHSNLGGRSGRPRKLEEAVGEFREAIRLDPDEALPYSNLGKTLMDQGKLRRR